MTQLEKFYKKSLKTIHKKVLKLADEIEEMNGIGTDAELTHKVPLPEFISYKEYKLAKYLAEGVSSAEIGKIENVSTKTVDTWKGQLYKKMDVQTGAALVATFFRNGWLT